MTKKLNVFVDLDQTLADLLTGFLKYVNKSRGLQLELRDIKTYSWMIDFIDPDVSEYWKNPGPYSNGDVKIYYLADWFMNILKERYNVKIITSSAKSIIEEKNDFIKRNFGIEEKDIIHSHEKWKHVGDNILIDDYPYNINSTCYYNKKAIGILFNRQMTHFWANYDSKGVKTDRHLFASTYSGILNQLNEIQFNSEREDWRFDLK